MAHIANVHQLAVWANASSYLDVRGYWASLAMVCAMRRSICRVSATDVTMAILPVNADLLFGYVIVNRSERRTWGNERWCRRRVVAVLTVTIERANGLRNWLLIHLRTFCGLRRRGISSHRLVSLVAILRHMLVMLLHGRLIALEEIGGWWSLNKWWNKLTSLSRFGTLLKTTSLSASSRVLQGVWLLEASADRHHEAALLETMSLGQWWHIRILCLLLPNFQAILLSHKHCLLSMLTWSALRVNVWRRLERLDLPRFSGGDVVDTNTNLRSEQVHVARIATMATLISSKLDWRVVRSESLKVGEGVLMRVVRRRPWLMIAWLQLLRQSASRHSLMVLPGSLIDILIKFVVAEIGSKPVRLRLKLVELLLSIWRDAATIVFLLYLITLLCRLIIGLLVLVCVAGESIHKLCNLLPWVWIVDTHCHFVGVH